MAQGTSKVGKPTSKLSEVLSVNQPTLKHTASKNTIMLSMMRSAAAR
jgi:hypothetical protein